MTAQIRPRTAGERRAFLAGFTRALEFVEETGLRETREALLSMTKFEREPKETTTVRLYRCPTHGLIEFASIVQYGEDEQERAECPVYEGHFLGVCHAYLEGPFEFVQHTSVREIGNGG